MSSLSCCINICPQLSTASQHRFYVDSSSEGADLSVHLQLECTCWWCVSYSVPALFCWDLFFYLFFFQLVVCFHHLRSQLHLSKGKKKKEIDKRGSGFVLELDSLELKQFKGGGCTGRALGNVISSFNSLTVHNVMKSLEDVCSVEFLCIGMSDKAWDWPI